MEAVAVATDARSPAHCSSRYRATKILSAAQPPPVDNLNKSRSGCSTSHERIRVFLTAFVIIPRFGLIVIVSVTPVVERQKVWDQKAFNSSMRIVLSASFR